MGSVYTVILQDDFDWEYVGTNKSEKIIEIATIIGDMSECDWKPELLGQWYGHIVFDCEKLPIFIEDYSKVILSLCDSAIYWDDASPFRKTKLESTQLKEEVK